MTSQEFIDQYGKPVDDMIRFINAGNSLSVALSDLLDAFAALNASMPAEKGTFKKTSKPKK